LGTEDDLATFGGGIACDVEHLFLFIFLLFLLHQEESSSIRRRRQHGCKRHNVVEND